MPQLGLFEKEEVKPIEPRTTVRLGHRDAQIPLRRKRREALKKLIEVLDQLERKDVYIGTYGGAHSHFWLNNLKLARLQVEKPYWWDGDSEPRYYGAPVIVLWGRKGASVRIFTDQLVNVRQQEYQGYTLWLVDFWNGFGEYLIDPYRPAGYVSLGIVRFKD